MRRTLVFRCSAVVACLLAAVMAITPGCGSNDFLGLEDYQRDLLIGGLAAALLMQQGVTTGDDDPAPAPIDGRDGEDGLSCWDLDGDGVADPEEDVNGDGDFTALDCVGAAGVNGVDGPAGDPGQDGAPGLRCWDLDGDGVGDPGEDANDDGMFDTRDCQGSDGGVGPAGPAGNSGLPGQDGADGPEFFDVFIDDFFTVVGGPYGDLPVQFVSIAEPVLGFRSPFSGTSSVAGFRVAIPDRYMAGNDVMMRLFFHRTGEYDEGCFVFTVDGRRLIDGSDIEVYGERRWVRPDAIEVGDGGTASILGTFIVVDLPINTPAGLDYPEDLAGGDFLGFELNTHQLDGYSYHLLGVEFIESSAGSAVLSGAGVFMTEDDIACSFDDCNENSIPDEYELDGNDCNENSVLDECDILKGTSQDCQPNGIPDECDGGCPECLTDADCVDDDLCTIETCGQGTCVSVPVECPEGWVCVNGVCID